MTHFGAYFSLCGALRVHVPREGEEGLRHCSGFAWPCSSSLSWVVPSGSCCWKGEGCPHGAAVLELGWQMLSGAVPRCTNCPHVPRARVGLVGKSWMVTGSRHHGWLSSAPVPIGWELLWLGGGPRSQGFLEAMRGPWGIARLLGSSYGSGRLFFLPVVAG